MLIKRPTDIPSSEITDQKVYLNRRAFIRAAAAAAAGLGAAGTLACSTDTEPVRSAATPAAAPGPRTISNISRSPLSTNEQANTFEQISTYNNYYEFGIDKDAPARYAHTLRPEPWSVIVEGECAKPATWNLEDILKGEALEERIYRHRCVEAWSMVIPWVGFPLASFIAKCEPTTRAKYVQFFTLADPEQMPGLRSPVLDWPYTEGLRMDEAMHPLTILAVGLYDQVLPNQNGAPIRLVVPWKYGFKGAKSIVRMRFVEQEPVNSWQLAAPREYGFYSNVNPMVDHPRWSQATEIRLPGFFKNHRTQMFNGYADQVAHLYAGMDLRRYY